mmetsp:Transcript_7102/g.9825  ORF Transcript_7102/g.9825 Transcript_7102/m.9825 type:complete len:240 (+) Transcript_7102:1465-2184(+)
MLNVLGFLYLIELISSRTSWILIPDLRRRFIDGHVHWHVHVHSHSHVHLHIHITSRTWAGVDWRRPKITRTRLVVHHIWFPRVHNWNRSVFFPYRRCSVVIILHIAHHISHRPYTHSHVWVHSTLRHHCTMHALHVATRWSCNTIAIFWIWHLNHSLTITHHWCHQGVHPHAHSHPKLRIHLRHGHSIDTLVIWIRVPSSKSLHIHPVVPIVHHLVLVISVPSSLAILAITPSFLRRVE